VAVIIIGSFGVVVELIYWHGRWDHLAIYSVVWLAHAFLCSAARWILARE
jgi:hypothetical protein